MLPKPELEQNVLKEAIRAEIAIEDGLRYANIPIHLQGRCVLREKLERWAQGRAALCLKIKKGGQSLTVKLPAPKKTA
jgi:hypothetical protein